MSSESVHTILQPLLIAVAISLVVFAAATVLLWRDGRRQKRQEGEA